MYRPGLTSAALSIVAILAAPVLAQDAAAAKAIRVTPPAVTLNVGEERQLEADVLDVGGRPVKADVFFFSRNRRAVQVDSSGKIKALLPGTHQVLARVVGAGGGRGQGSPSTIVTVTVPYPELAKIVFANTPTRIYQHTTVRVDAAVLDKAGNKRPDLTARFASSNQGIATIDEFGQITGLGIGRCAINATAGGLSSKLELEIVANPVRSLELTSSKVEARTGDVVHFGAVAKNAVGQETRGVPVHYSFHAQPTDDLGNAATGQIEQDGRFVAEAPGLYTIVATCGNVATRKTLKVAPRNVQQRLVKVGHGEVLDVHTSDLWVWEGVDGRDYAVTGTWGANGDAIFWDVTDPAHLERIATVKVDARTVNDVKVSEDGKYCILSREGASNRKNGIIVLDVQNPRSPKMLSKFTNNLTGGVHNLFIYKKHVYALSAGRRYDVINIEDPEAPHRVGTFELQTPGHSIHDVWVSNGIAFSSNWRNGVQLVDVGNGIKGGSPSNPVKIASYAYPSGWNHAAFPYRSKETGKFYVIAGDETFPYGLSTKEKPTYPRGWFHFIDFTDLDNPKEVARYEVPEAGTHNLWVEGDVLYAAYYNGGVRVVDISGELMGDLYRQGREIGWFLPTHHKGVVPNAPMTWGPQPHKGHIFFSDWNSGLWCVKIAPARGGRR